MNILLIHADRFKWAANNRAEALKKQWSNDNVTITNCDDLEAIDGDAYDIIHFLYSGGITKQIDFILKYKDKIFTTLASERTLDLYFDKKNSLIKIYRKTVCCVCHNNELVDKLKALTGADNAVYIPNGVDIDLFKRKLVVGFIGYRADSSDHKGLSLVERACYEIDAKLILLDGNYIKHEKMPDFYRQIDCLVLPSRSEGCNNPILEALAMNKPVITTKTGIAIELDGVFLTERDVESIVQALKRISGRQLILKKYTWKIISEKYKKLYKMYEK